MRLQVSLDRMDLQKGLNFIECIYDVIDIVEIGTPLVYKEGLRAVTEMRKYFPDKTILADLKIMDGGESNAKFAYEAGADIVTVLAVAEDKTIEGAMQSAKKYEKEIYIDMISVRNFNQRAQQVDQMGVSYIGVHTGVDSQALGKRPTQQLHELKGIIQHSKIAVAGGIDLETLPEIVKEEPDIIVCGKSITESESPRQIILAMRSIIEAR